MSAHEPEPARDRAHEPAAGLERCPGCAAELAPTGGPVHRYVESSPSCWAAYGAVLAREYEDPAYRVVHRLTVDAYAAQHPGRPSRQAIRSVALHLIGLHAVLERGLPTHATLQRIRGRARSGGFEWLEPPADRGAVTVASVLRARTAAEHAAAVRRWAEAVWTAWSPHHARVRAWAAG